MSETTEAPFTNPELGGTLGRIHVGGIAEVKSLGRAAVLTNLAEIQN